MKLEGGQIREGGEVITIRRTYDKSITNRSLGRGMFQKVQELHRDNKENMCMTQVTKVQGKSE